MALSGVTSHNNMNVSRGFSLSQPTREGIHRLKLAISSANFSIPSELNDLSGAVKGKTISIILPINTRTTVAFQILRNLSANVSFCPAVGASMDVGVDVDVGPVGVRVGMARDEIPIFAEINKTYEQHLRFIMEVMKFQGPGGGPAMIIGETQDAELLIREGLKAEDMYGKTRTLPDPSSADNVKSGIVLSIIKDVLQTDPKFFSRISDSHPKMIAADSDSFFLSAVLASKESSSAGHNDLTTTVTDPEVPTLNSYRYAFPHVLFEAVNGVVAGKKFMVWGYGDGGKRCTHALMQAGADVAVYEDGHVHWRPEGPVLKLEEALPKIDVFVYTARDDKDNKIMFDHVRNMKKLVVLVNIEGSDKGFDMEGVLSCPGVVGRETMTSGIDILDFPRNERRVIVVGQGNPMKMAWVPQHSIFYSLFDAEAFLSFADFTAGSTREQAAVSSTGGVDTNLAPAADNDDEREWLMVPWLII